MKIQTLSILAGTTACNARCPYCISKMTPTQGMSAIPYIIHKRNFKIACRLAQMCGVTTAMITGKGEPTLYPDIISEYLGLMEEFRFPFIELQTNGIAIADNIVKPFSDSKYYDYLKEWYNKGLSTIAISVAHYLPEKNKEIITPHRDQYIDVVRLIDLLHRVGFSVRLSCVLLKWHIDNPSEVINLVDRCRMEGIEQLTLTSIRKPDAAQNKEVSQWVGNHQLNCGELDDIHRFLEKNATKLMTLIHGAVIYDLNGQNVCLNDCLTINSSSEDLRQLIFFPDGHLRYDWRYPGAILL